MPPEPSAQTASQRLKPLLDGAVGFATVGSAQDAAADRSAHAMADLAGGVMRTVGPWLTRAPDRARQSRGRVPRKIRRARSKRSSRACGTISAASARNSPISTGIWDARPDAAARDDIVYSPETLERFQQLRDDGKPALIFAAHLANWELPALVAARYGLAAHVLYRAPEHRRDRRRGARHPRGRDGHAGANRARRAGPAGRCACTPAATSPCWSISITCAAST